MNPKNKYFDRLISRGVEFNYFKININQEYLYHSKTLQPWHRFAMKYFLVSYDSAIEVGCGNGALIETIDARLRVGLELDEKAASQVNSNLVKVQLINLEKYSSKRENNNAFDVIFAFEVMEHFSNPLDFVMSCNKLLKVGGCVIGSTPNARRWWLDIFTREEFDMPPNHFVAFDREQLTNLFNDYGFKIKYLDSAFVYQNWRHVLYRISILFNRFNVESRFILLLRCAISIFMVPIFCLMNLIPNKYLHHGFVIEKIYDIK